MAKGFIESYISELEVQWPGPDFDIQNENFIKKHRIDYYEGDVLYKLLFLRILVINIIIESLSDVPWFYVLVQYSHTVLGIFLLNCCK